MKANSRSIDSAVGSDLEQARPDAWHLCRVLIPRRSIAGRLVWGTVRRRDRGGRWVYKKVIERMAVNSKPVSQIEAQRLYRPLFVFVSSVGRSSGN